MKPINSHGLSCRWLGVGLSLVAAVASQAQVAVTYQVDMSTETSTPTSVYVTGTPSGMGWAEFPVGFNLTNVSGTIWSGTFTDTNPVGTVEQVKFTDNVTGWESSANRQFLLGTTGTVGPGTEVLPLATWNTTSTWPAPTNEVTFQVNLGPQIELGNFVPGGNNQTITVSGSFEGWDNGLALSNNPSAVGLLTNVFAGTYPVVGFPGATTIDYKFRLNGGWESPISTAGNNRVANITGSPQVLPLVFYNDNSSSYDFCKTNYEVTFTLYITNGTPDDSGTYNFTKGTDTIYVSGDWLGWPTWGPNALPADQQMIEVGTSDYYTNTLPVPAGNSIFLSYKYSLDGVDDENGSQTNHIRLIRNFGTNYSFPTDQWSFIYQPGANTETNIVEQSFGNLGIGAPSGGNVPITWLGRPGVVLLNGSDLHNQSSWKINSGTDSAMSTNWPAAGGGQYFQLELLP
jgi:hypothetical protein